MNSTAFKPWRRQSRKDTEEARGLAARRVTRVMHGIYRGDFAEATMLQHSRKLLLLVFVLTMMTGSGLFAQNKAKARSTKPNIGSAPAVIWREPADIKARDLYWGPGGKEHAPQGTMTFIKEKLNGTRPKFDMRDSNGIRWGVKFGIEAKPETAATRLVWAVGYFTNEDYYVPELPVKGLPRLSRGEDLIRHGVIYGARLKRHNTDEEEIGDWSWNQNPFVGTRELNGLKIMMEILCNTDLARDNQHVYDEHGVEQRYVAVDLGLSFGLAGKTHWRTAANLKAYDARPLIAKVGPDYVDFWHFKHIPRADAKWIGGWLGQLSDAQISDAFRAADFSPAEVQGFTEKVREKINELNNL
jgi:hypothetical protein